MDISMTEDLRDRGFYCLPYNLGVSGDNLVDIAKRLESEVRARLDKDNPKEKVQLVFAAGINDSLFFINKQQPNFTDEQFRNNLLNIIKIAQGFSHDISFIGLLPVHDEKLNPLPWAPDEAYANIHVERFENIIRDVCLEHRIKFFPMYAHWRKLDDFTKYLIDGVHPNPDGHALMAEQIKDFLLTEEFIKFHSQT